MVLMHVTYCALYCVIVILESVNVNYMMWVITIATPCPWLPAVLQELLCHTFQRILIEPEEPIRLLLWQVIIITMSNETV